MTDAYERTIDYMRISLTDRCNLRCQYCMPNDIELVSMKELLTLEEIVIVCEEAVGLGIRKLKVTGGEPLVRKGCVDFIKMLKNIDGIEQVTMTTNGVLLENVAEQLKDNGLDAVNISLDTLNREKFVKITGYDKLEDVKRAIQRCCDINMPTKINAVLQKGVNEDEWEALLLLAKHAPLHVRFIEMMPIGFGRYFEPVYNEELLQKIKKAYGDVAIDETIHGNGPAVYYSIPGFSGSIGFIHAMHGKFCNTCNRIRLSSTGQIKPCLCFEQSIDLKKAVREKNREKVRETLKEAILSKPKEHQFEAVKKETEKTTRGEIKKKKEGNIESKQMVQIGG